MKRAIFNFCSYLIALALLVWIFWYMMPPGQFDALKRFTATDVAILLFLTLGAYLGNGLEYYLMSSKLGVKMDIRDIILLPLAMNLAGTLLPIQGAMAYQVWFFKKKYGVSLSHGFAIAAFLYLLTMTLGGIAGMIIFALGRTSSRLFLAVSAVFAISSLFAVGLLFCIRKIGPFHPAADRAVGFVRSILEGVATLLKDFRMVLALTAIYLLRLLSMVAMFFWIARCLGFEVSLLALLLLNLWNMLSLILKITPSNLGISQLVSGVMFAMIDLPKEQGVMISLVATLAAMVMAFSFGLPAMGYGLWEISGAARRNEPGD